MAQKHRDIVNSWNKQSNKRHHTNDTENLFIVVNCSGHGFPYLPSGITMRPSSNPETHHLAFASHPLGLVPSSITFTINEYHIIIYNNDNLVFFFLPFEVQKLR